jgi:hypothetical protein
VLIAQRSQNRRPSMDADGALGSRLDHDQNATTLAKATAEAKLAASLS